MNKRETLHLLIDKLLDVSETGTKKELSLFYFDLENGSSFDFSFREGNGSNKRITGRSLFFGGPLEKLETVNEALAEIERVKTIPDVEPKINLNLCVEKARELGLIE